MKTFPVLLGAFRLEGITGWWWLVWGVLAVVAAAFLVWTYRGIYQRSGRSLTWWLLALRGVGLFLLLLIIAQPVWTREREEVDPGRVAVVVDTSRSMSLADESGTTRYERARQAAEELRRAVAARGGARLQVDFFDITGTPIKELPREPAHDYTDLTKALRQTMSRLRSRPVAGVVLISDGADTSCRSSFQDWEDTGVAIHTIGFPRSVELDLAVREPQAERRVIVHNETIVQVPVSKKGAPALEATVTLRRGREELATKKVKLPAGDVEQVVSLSYKPDQPGSFELTAEVQSAAGEKDTGNNAVNFPLEVVKDPIRVLYVEGYLRNEYTFLVRHFGEKDPDVSLVVEPRRSSPDGPEKQLRDSVLNEKVLEKIDVVILGDMEGDYLSGAQYRALTRWLEGKNHSLLVLGGYASFGPKGFRTQPLLADALPVVFADAAEPQLEKPFQLQLTDKGKGHPMFTVSPDKVRSEKMWAEAAPLDGMPLVARAKPGADVLAVNPTAQVEGKPAVALAVQRAAGGGQVMVMCPDTTWHWSRVPRLVGQDDTLYSRFWSQAIRWLAGRALDDTRPLLSVRTGKPVYDVKQKVTVQVVRQRRPGSDLTGAVFSVDVTGPKGQRVPILAPRVDSSDPDLATVEFTPDTAGRYEIAAALKAEGKVLANQTGELRVRGPDLELTQTGTRPENLRAIKEATGGVYADVGNVSEIVAALQPIERRRTEVKRSEFWDWPPLFIAFLVAVTGEWFLRRRNHLV